MPEYLKSGGFGLYFHWPYCLAKCPYCDFNSHVSASIEPERWKAAYISEIERAGEETSGRILESVFFGGGTPSLMPPDLVSAVLEKVGKTWPRTNDFEVTLEANPTSVEAGRFQGFRDAGVNRVSVGIQALDDRDLKALGRQHSVGEARAAFDLARDTFERVSFDLIYARQDQSLADWKTELGTALGMAADHLSLYQLTIEDGTAFGKRFKAGKLQGLPDEDLSADMYFATQELCEAAGMPAYEVSNHARPGARSRHNMIYWKGGDYIGIGPGAHGRLSFGDKRFAVETPLHPERWLSLVETSGSGELPRNALSKPDQLAEYLMMGLRVREGVSVDRLRKLVDGDILSNNINKLLEIGLLETTRSSLRVTAKGRPLLNAVLRELLPTVP